MSLHCAFQWFQRTSCREAFLSSSPHYFCTSILTLLLYFQIFCLSTPKKWKLGSLTLSAAMSNYTELGTVDKRTNCEQRCLSPIKGQMRMFGNLHHHRKRKWLHHFQVLPNVQYCCNHRALQKLMFDLLFTKQRAMEEVLQKEHFAACADGYRI